MANTKPMEHKQFDAYISDVDEDQGIVKAIFSVFGNVDEGYDRIHPGAFSKTFAERGHKVLVLDNHNMTSAVDAVAKVKELRELSRDELPEEVLTHYPDATGGAELTAQFEPNPDNDAKSAGIFYRLKNKWLKEWSFGYDALDVSYTDEQVKGEDARVRNLHTVKLYEVSPVLLGMNTATMTTGAKADGVQDEDSTTATEVPQEILSDTEAPEPEDKAGRALSARNASRIVEAINTLQSRDITRTVAAIDILNGILADTGNLDDSDPDITSETMELNGVSQETPPTSDGAGPEGVKSVDYLNLIEIEQQKLNLLEV